MQHTAPQDETSEFGTLEREPPDASYSAATRPENAIKNRYSNVLPLDSTRVRLVDCPGAPRFGEDYINASHVTPRYVLTQAPPPECQADFWHMIWQLDVPLIVMLTRLTEQGRVKAECYWPCDEQPLHAGPFSVLLQGTEMRGGALAIHLRLCLGQAERGVCLLRDERWADFGCPKALHDVLSLLTTCEELASVGRGPTVIHCSAGVGRSGTLCGLLLLRERKRSGAPISVADTVRQLRYMRAGAVQSPCQYALLCDLVAFL